ncbi:hypothetical protein [Ferrimonas balearica]|uniref:hypothetical protein n=1 Tax=Ferrimonas balearica TaxID=44012 RepID=UPI001C93B62A|nr:hypothetical protein [Ferrimonas balearica]MBY5981279.1 hypothetical protein [Ferrimonas balearica]MBY6018664.1 hypothetical protein [Halomonas denitrificans]
MVRIPRASAMVMAFWLLAIALVAPAHELSHVHDDITFSEHCDFFAHQAQLQQLFSHQLAPLDPVTPFRWQADTLPLSPWLSLQVAYTARAPPLNSRV